MRERIHRKNVDYNTRVLIAVKRLGRRYRSRGGGCVGWVLEVEGKRAVAGHQAPAPARSGARAKIQALPRVCSTLRWRKADSNRWSHFDRDAFQNTILGPGATHRFKDRSASARGETDVSNPLSSSRQSVSIPEPLSKVENPAFGAGLRGWLGDRGAETPGCFDIAPTGGNVSVGPNSSTAVRLM